MGESISFAQQEYRIQQIRRRRRILAARILLFLGLLAGWEISAETGWINDFIFSSPSRMVNCFLSMTADRSIFYHTGITLLETLVSFLLVTVLGIAGALLLWLNRDMEAVLEPYLVMLNSLPKSAMAPILIVWMGANVKTIITAAVSVALFGSVLTLFQGFCAMDRDHIKLIYTLGGRRADVLAKVLLPGSVPLLISNMKVNVGLCLIGVIIGEFLAARAGLGYLIIYGSQVFKMDWILMSVVILCMMAMGLYGCIAVLEKRCKKKF